MVGLRLNGGNTTADSTEFSNIPTTSGSIAVGIPFVNIRVRIELCALRNLKPAHATESFLSESAVSLQCCSKELMVPFVDENDGLYFERN